jgi:biopolymer transport protein ExbB
MSVLATVGSVAPFVGLLGTVLGIISAFQASLPRARAVGSRVRRYREALIETAFGLAVAIPSVLAFNYLNGQVVKDEMLLNNAAGELIDLMETWAEREVTGIAPAPTLGIARPARIAEEKKAGFSGETRTAAGQV